MQNQQDRDSNIARLKNYLSQLKERTEEQKRKAQYEIDRKQMHIEQLKRELNIKQNETLKTQESREGEFFE